jgi:TPP-dependent pyruvate/acetoin dehydrogenase alpha subunit
MWRTQRDPVTRMRKFLELKGLWSEDQEQKLQGEVKAQLAQAMEEAEKSPLPEPISVLDYAYAERTPHLEWERKELAAELGA